jgi:hypothetical protein
MRSVRICIRFALGGFDARLERNSRGFSPPAASTERGERPGFFLNDLRYFGGGKKVDDPVAS